MMPNPESTWSASLYRVRPERPDRSGGPLVPVSVPAREPVRTSAEPPSEQVQAPHPGGIYQDVGRGLRYLHFRANANTKELVQVASTVYAAAELLEERGLITSEDVEKRKAAVAERLSNEFNSRGMAVVFNRSDQDKYRLASTAVIDCENRVHLCRAACCKLRFALSRQDVEEGIVRWDFGNPYAIAQGEDGFCAHLDRGTRSCSVYKARPVPCRTYDCRKDQRIWLDFDKRIVNPDIARADWPDCFTPEQPPEVSEAATRKKGHFDEPAPRASRGTGVLHRLVQRMRKHD